MISPLTPKSSSTPSSSRAFCSSASLDSIWSRPMLFGSDRKCSVGISNLFEPMSEVCASRWTRAPGAGRGAGASTRVAASERKLRTWPAPEARLGSMASSPSSSSSAKSSGTSGSTVTARPDTISAKNSGSTRARPSALTRASALSAFSTRSAAARQPLGAAAVFHVEPVGLAIPGDGAADEGARREPPMDEGAKRQDAFVVLLVVVDVGSRRPSSSAPSHIARRSHVCGQAGRRHRQRAGPPGQRAAAPGRRRPGLQDSRRSTAPAA